MQLCFVYMLCNATQRFSGLYLVGSVVVLGAEVWRRPQCSPWLRPGLWTRRVV